ncbi:hypothetical protein [Hymenobacter terrestris]|uniref:Tripartite tricarboxylate transporter TctB family protein n=1 Tax=Hymenobacter terrestris TaxID=2748310 RepID=A0ABX2PZP6_9BACT|nr:hypothetical protein [Hymenobacter terrestris]NVO84160.1 hypothetical protein [Hymenobacter terrestris]
MRKLLTSLFVLAVNFYFGAAVGGVAATLYTFWQGPVSAEIGVGLVVAVLLACTAYQVFRARFAWQSPGEMAVGNTSKTDLLIQSKPFSISRIPLFLLLLLTLALPGNFLDGVGDGRIYDLPQIFTIALLYLGFYRGLDFFEQPGFAATAMFFGGLLLSATVARTSEGAVPILFLILAGLWLIAWLVYRRFYLPAVYS